MISTYTSNKAVTKGTKNTLNGIHIIIIEGDDELITLLLLIPLLK